MPSKMVAVVASLRMALTLGTSMGEKFSGMAPLRAGLKIVACKPIKKTTPTMAVQFMLAMAHTPNSMAASSINFDQTTSLLLGTRSTSHPAQAEQTTKGRANMAEAMPCMDSSPALAASNKAACLKKLSLNVPMA